MAQTAWRGACTSVAYVLVYIWCCTWAACLSGHCPVRACRSLGKGVRFLSLTPMSPACRCVDDIGAHIFPRHRIALHASAGGVMPTYVLLRTFLFHFLKKKKNCCFSICFYCFNPTSLQALLQSHGRPRPDLCLRTDCHQR